MTLEAMAVVLTRPEHIALSRVPIADPGDADVVVDVEWSGISTGTEKLLFTGRMPDFPGMGYPLVPGYEAVGRIAAAGPQSGATVGARVFVPGARCFGDLRGLFGASASRLVVPGARTVPIADDLGERGVLLALAATAYHTLRLPHALPDLIVGHGVLGRLLARLALALGAPPTTVWETNPQRRHGAEGYRVCDPADDDGKYRTIYDVSGDGSILDRLIARLSHGGEIVLAGFYSTLSFAFPAAFMREARLRIAAEFQDGDVAAVNALLANGLLSLDGLITHRADPARADDAYRTAFGDPDCLKMILDWKGRA